MVFDIAGVYHQATVFEIQDHEGGPLLQLVNRPRDDPGPLQIGQPQASSASSSSLRSSWPNRAKVAHLGIAQNPVPSDVHRIAGCSTLARIGLLLTFSPNAARLRPSTSFRKRAPVFIVPPVRTRHTANLPDSPPASAHPCSQPITPRLTTPRRSNEPMRLGHVMHVGRCRWRSLLCTTPRLRVHVGDVQLATRGRWSLIPLLYLAHLRVPLPHPVLGGRRRFEWMVEHPLLSVLPHGFSGP